MSSSAARRSSSLHLPIDSRFPVGVNLPIQRCRFLLDFTIDEFANLALLGEISKANATVILDIVFHSWLLLSLQGWVRRRRRRR
ncbi:hypothetical protein G5V59_12845 [Nocardioides sp. W3-2-3]|uniref:hypothetical protein n=1 Tax=Nocardioides convexus TaxID=2712224 RepID=UPI00241830AB|nr:hypothetical protein [Nocardioides convexus]NHA00603.1 hypothetical protein [Nocardioides convexus]